MGNYTMPLGSQAAESSIAGAKGANLSELIRAGFQVPAGYVITTRAYRAFVMANDLEEQVAELSTLLKNGNVASQEGASKQIRALFESASMPDEIRYEIIDRYRALGEAHGRGGKEPLDRVAVAVRSSATFEDLPGASFAGQLDTLLNVRGEQALIESVTRCFSSLWTTRAMRYRLSQHYDTKQLDHAVIVQEMVAPDCAGVLFTVNPVSGDYDEVVINAAWGLGEAVVSGEVTPDNIIVEKGNERVKRVEVGSKQIMALAGATGIGQVPVATDLRHKQVLDEEKAIELARLGKALEGHFGGPQDVEWAISHDCLYILQSRPVTSNIGKPFGEGVGSQSDGGEAAVPGDDDWPAAAQCKGQPFDLWTRSNVGELWPNPVSPLVWSTIPDIIGGIVRFAFRGVKSDALKRAQWAARFYGRVYYNEGALTHFITEDLGLPASFVDRSRGNDRKASRDRDERIRLGRVLLHLPVLLRLSLRQRRTSRDLEALLIQVDRWVQDFNAERFAEKSDQQLWDEAMLWLERLKTTLNLQNEMSGLSMTAFATLERMMIRWLKMGDLAHDLITGLSGIETAEMGGDLSKIAKKIQDLGLSELVLKTDARVALDQLRQNECAAPVMDLLGFFLERHGHRCANEAEWLHPRWADAPEQVVELVAAYLKAGILDVAESEARQRRAAVIARVESRLGPLRWFFLRRVLARTQDAVRLRDNGKNGAMKASYPARQLAVLIGQRWTELGWLKEPEDIFFLTLTDLHRVIEAGDPVKAGFHICTLVSERRKAFEYWFDRRAPDVIGADGKPVHEGGIQSETAKLGGIAASGGVVRGKVRIVNDPVEAMRLQPGDILVTRSTDAGWTAVFPLIAGLVTEIGGQLSHAAIIAREYGIPAVVNVWNATEILEDQQMITVDGSKGLIFLDVEGGPSAKQP